MKTGRD